MDEYSSPTTSPEGEGLDGGPLAGFLTEAEEELLLSPELQELLEGVMRELYEEISPPEKEVDLMSPAASASSSSSSLSSLTMDGESCGASVSDSASTVMAGVEFAGNPTCGGGGWCVVLEGEGGKSNDLKELGGLEMDGCDGMRFWG